MWKQVYPRVEICKQNSRGAVLVQNTYGWETLAAAVARRSQATHCSHLRPRVSVGKQSGSEQTSKAGSKVEQTVGSHVPEPP